jgi:FKBP-type peptidyl-prolyl cis-trans isomerase SlyD
MKIAQGQVVGLKYVLKDDTDTVVDSSGGKPLYYPHGRGKLLPALEKVLEGKSVGWKGSILVSAVEGYGAYDSSLVFEVPLERFDGASPSVGEIVALPNPDGSDYRAKVIREGDQELTLDANHPLAGLALTWEIEVISIKAGRR